MHCLRCIQREAGRVGAAKARRARAADEPTEEELDALIAETRLEKERRGSGTA